MGLGELFSIIAAKPVASGLRERFYRQLRKIDTALDRLVKQGESSRIDHIFRIVKHHLRKTGLGASLIIPHCLEQTVQTICLGAGAIAVMDK